MAATTAKPGEVVWYPADGSDEWTPCKLIAKNEDGGAVVKIKGNDVSVRPEDVHKILPREPPEKLTGKLTDLECDGLGPEDVEDNIRQHFCITVPYTNIDDVVISVNPIREVPIHDKEWVHKYAELDPNLPPHIFNAAAVAYKNLQENKQSQSIVLMGEPSAGKSRAYSNILNFMLEIAGDQEVDDKIKALQEVLKPFLSLRLSVGSGQDQFTWLSTRALLSLELNFDEDGFICRATASVSGLESSRVASPGDGTNFDVLYKAVRDPSGQDWLGDLDEFKLLGEDFDASEYDKDASELNAWKKALSIFDLDASHMVRFLCGLLLLGEIKFAANKAGIDCEGPVDQAAKALGVQAKHLEAAFTAGGTVESAEAARDATLEDVYVSLLARVIQKANSVMVGDSEPSGLNICIVEMPTMAGVWPRALQPGSSFEMLMSQWLAEIVNSQLVVAAMQPYVQQLGHTGLRLDLTRLPAHVSALRALRAIEGPKGILSKLRPLAAQQPSAVTSELVRKEFTDWARLVEKEASVAGEAPLLKVTGRSPEVSCEIAGSSTTLGHTLDLKLVQSCAGVSVPAKVKTLFMQSSQKLVAEVMSSNSSTLSSSKGLGAAEETVTFVRNLLQGKDKKRAWFVCCMRPNDKGKFGIISKPVLLKQVRTFCLADLVHFSSGAKKASYSIVWPVSEFKKQYEALSPKVDKRATDAEICRQIIATHADGHATVGAEIVYGTHELANLLKVRIQEKKTQPSGKEKKALGPEAANKKLGEAQKEQADPGTERELEADSNRKVKEESRDAQSPPEASEKSLKKDTSGQSLPKSVSEKLLSKVASEKSLKNDASKDGASEAKDALKKDVSAKSLMKAASEKSIKSNKSQDEKSEGGTALVWCQCGTEFEEGAMFCRNCGNRRPEVAPEVTCTCGTVFKDDAKFCRKCGSRRPAQAADPVTCIACGTTISEDAAFCTSCGAKRQDSEAYVAAGRSSDSGRRRSARRASAPNELSARLDEDGSLDKIAASKMRPAGGAAKKKELDPRMENINSIVARSPSPPSSSGDEYVESPIRPPDDPTGAVFFSSSMENERGPFRSMSLAQHATLHSALSQMAAVLRVAKESETKLRSSQNAHNAELEELRAECDAWRVESDRLWVQVKELQQQAFWRAPQSA